METIITNKQVEKAGYYYIGHYNCGYLAIQFDDCEIHIYPSKCKYFFDFLYNIFDIDSENGIWFEQIKGKYCRLEFDENFNLISICHIIRDSRFLIKDLKGE